ncbi:MAG: inositol monophosphatase [Oscillochloris sp.]|nr:inositol monophosphatase [Oscillochloris sp.]
MLDFAINLAYRAGAMLRAATEHERRVDSKQHHDIVTDADKASEALILEAIRTRYPDHAILAEESGAQMGQSGYTWIVDPLDGTLNYFHGFPFFSVSIGLRHNGAGVLGVVYDPLRNELFYAERERGAFVNGRRIRVSATATLDQALLTTGFPYRRFSHPDNNLREFSHLALRAREIRRAGSAALDICYAAAGRSDGHWEVALSPWDTAAATLILQEAGGAITDYNGAAWTPESDRIVATNGIVHAELLRELAAAL